MSKYLFLCLVFLSSPAFAGIDKSNKSVSQEEDIFGDILNRPKAGQRPSMDQIWAEVQKKICPEGCLPTHKQFKEICEKQRGVGFIYGCIVGIIVGFIVGMIFPYSIKIVRKEHRE